jgi:hypothetical protein
LISALHKLIAATLAVWLWPYLVDGLVLLVEYFDDAPSYQGPDDFWPVVRYFRLFCACSIVLAWIARWAINKFHAKRAVILSYTSIYALFVTIFFTGEKYSDIEAFGSALHAGLIPLSMIFSYDIFYGVLAKALSRLRSE